MTTQLVQIRCNSLRSKSSYGAFGDFDEEMTELTGSTTTYWCLKTMSKAGPAMPPRSGTRCASGRASIRPRPLPTCRV